MRWVVAGGMSVSVFVLTTILTFQGVVDSRQDDRIADVDARQEASMLRQDSVFEKLSENGRRTAEALSDVAATLREMDRRGTQVFREHELRREEEVH
jgi:hypothetical protein